MWRLTHVNRVGDHIVILLQLTTPSPLLQEHKSQQWSSGRRIRLSIPRVHGYVETRGLLLNEDGLFVPNIIPHGGDRYRRWGRIRPPYLARAASDTLSQ